MPTEMMDDWPAPQAAPSLEHRSEVRDACRILVSAARRIAVRDVDDRDALALWDFAWRQENQ